jgi:hypothetical protein
MAWKGIGRLLPLPFSNHKFLLPGTNSAETGGLELKLCTVSYRSEFRYSWPMHRGVECGGKNRYTCDVLTGYQKYINNFVV